MAADCDGQPNRYHVRIDAQASRAMGEADLRQQSDLLSSALFLAIAHTESFDAGGMELTLVLGQRYRKSAPLFVGLLRTQLASYAELFGDPPLWKRYLLIINGHESGDGGAFAGSFSQFIQADADDAAG